MLYELLRLGTEECSLNVLDFFPSGKYRANCSKLLLKLHIQHLSRLLPTSTKSDLHAQIQHVV